MRQQKGFTLVELLVTLGLAGIIISIVMSFFIANIKSYEVINIESELQYQSQYIINFMTNKILEAESIKTINSSEDKLEEKNKQQISEISFKYEDGTTHVFAINSENTLTYNGSDIGSYIKQISVTPIPEDGTFKDAYGLKIELILEKAGKRSYTAEQTVYMRNSGNQ